MAWNTAGPARLGADNVLRFTSADHFLKELAGNLGRGRAFVQTRRNFDLQTTLSLRIEAPGIAWGVSAEAIVVFSRDGFVGLEFEHFEERVLPKLDRLGEEIAKNAQPEAQAERTVVAPMPPPESAREAHAGSDQRETTDDLDMDPWSSGESSAIGHTILDLDTADDERTGKMRLTPDFIDSLDEREVPDPAEESRSDPAPEPASMPRSGTGSPRGSGNGDPGRAPEDGAGRGSLLRATRSTSGARVRHIEAATMRLEDVPERDRIRPLDRANTELHDEPAEAPRPAQLRVEGLDALDDRAMRVWRATGGGVIRASDMSSLLGLYLAEIRHGHVTLYGGPDGAPGERVKLKIAAGHVTMLDATIAARIGDWVTVAIEDASPLLDLLRESRDSWAPALDALGAEPSVQAPRITPIGGADSARPETPGLPALKPRGIRPPKSAATLPSGPPSHVDDELPYSAGAETDLLSAQDPVPRADASAHAGRQDHSDLIIETPRPVEPMKAAEATARPALAKPVPVQAPATPPPQARGAAPGTPTPEPARPSPPVPTPVPAASEPPSAPRGDAGPPRVAQLHGEVVAFSKISDLLHELETNLKNGGLLVESPPLALRTRRSLKVSVGGVMTSVSLEADVVFASGGRVGFSVVNAQETRAQLERALESLPALLNTQNQAPGPHETTQPPKLIVANETSASMIPSFSGRVLPPLSIGDLLDYQSRRPKSVTDLSNAAVLPLFEFICRQSGRGVLTLKSGVARLTIYFHEGSAAYVETHPFDEGTSLGRILIASKKLNDSAFREGLDRAKQLKRPLGRVLVSLGSVTKKILADALREQTRARIDQGFTWKDGTFEWGPWREPPGDADLVLTKGFGIFARYVRGCFENLGTSDLEALLGRNMSRVVIARDDVDVLATVIGLQQKDLRFIELSLAGERTIADAVTGSPIGRLASMRLVTSGLSIGLLLYKDGRHAAQSAAHPPRSASDNESPIPARMKRELKERLTLLKSLNHFEVLGVHWSAHHRSYRAAHEKARSDLLLNRPPLRDAPLDVQEAAKEVLRVVDHAYNTLIDEAQRISYRKQLFDKTERQYSADMLVKQGEVALMRGDRVGAIEALETAAELDPSPRNRSLLMSAREGKS